MRNAIQVKSFIGKINEARLGDMLGGCGSYSSKAKKKTRASNPSAEERRRSAHHAQRLPSTKEAPENPISATSYKLQAEPTEQTCEQTPPSYLPYLGSLDQHPQARTRNSQGCI